MKRVLKGLKIFEKYVPDSDICAEHDVIYAGFGLKLYDVSSDDLKVLEENRWHVDEEDEGWYKFV